MILNRVQIYDCEIGVVKCFDVYLSSPPTLSKGEGEETRLYDQ
jgi:hypothetical protein